MSIIIRNSAIEDIPSLHKIFAIARQFMANTGNPNQWKEDYPSEELLTEDIQSEDSYVCVEEGEIVATFVLRGGIDPTYNVIYEGAWLNDGPYATIHRIASNGKVKGIFRLAMQFALLHYSSIRIDTHADNVVMQNAIRKAGFKYCGIIHCWNGSERLAYQFIPQNINSMNIAEISQNRYSCRDYKATPVSDEQLAYIQECVRMAPSAVNKQPWRFHVIKSEAAKQKLQQCYNRDWFKTAPMYILASVLHDEEWVRADGKAHGNIDVAIAVEHLCLAATEQGLGSCWVCNFEAKLCSELFQLPDNEEPVVIIPLGTPNCEITPKKRKAITEIFVTE